MNKWMFLMVIAVMAMVGCGDDDHAGHDHGDHAGHDHGDHANDKDAAKGKDGSGSHAHEGSHKLMDQAVFFKAPANGAKVKSPFKVVFGIKGMEVKPAGAIVENTGHHHLLINKMHMNEGEVIPADDKHIHFGKGQTEHELSLEPGEYVLTMQFANGAHQSYGPLMSSTIKVTVEK